MRPFLLLLTAAALCFAQGPVRSTISVYDLGTKQSRQVFTGKGFYEAPYWSADGRYLMFQGGPMHQLLRIPAAGGTPEAIDIGPVEFNHDHGFSPDGKYHAISLKGELFISAPDGKGRHQLTRPGDIFYLHTWSPDSGWILGTRKVDAQNYDICRITPDGSKDECLTSNAAFDDGPDYTHDGKWVYFNSNRAGSLDIWRMPSNGSDKVAERVTADEYEDWFPHPSPDGRWLLLLSYQPGVRGMHPFNEKVMIRIRPLRGAKPPKTLVRLIGGQGSLNLNSWSPDSKKFAYAAYEPHLGNPPSR